MRPSPLSWTTVLLTLGLHSLSALASPSSRSLSQKNPIRRREDTPVHCVDSTAEAPEQGGNLFCYDDSGDDLTCDECLGLDGNEPAKSENGVICHISEGNADTLGQRTACPGDPPPEKNPDGTPSSDVAEGVMDAYCAAAGSGGLFGWTTFAACYAYTYASANGDPLEEAEAGVNGRC